MSRWDIILFAVASYFAIMGLVRLMQARRKRLERQFQEEFRKQRQAVVKQQAEDERKARELAQQQQFEEFIKQKQKEVA
ncbi:hypothetical protein [Blastopirellula marina]|uniref:Uncharacterized protein n=1 Tax=Blastopirellula marina TaxID=124 RepID=A0A2S8FMF8_9BACT|nr:hypothetical protein [Blastopirellula marina]PQO33044.1 hypothetical protein C5Y98_18080 [Blastopirellula marina]PTL43211.1 hypothetical protein C5Y97_18090 [Blastopirellula marina]